MTDGVAQAVREVDPAPVPASSALELTLRALRPLLRNPEVTELCIN